jgi:hypothetical protein
MAKCVHCRLRKAKRACPALGREICPLCCGELRDREVHCPPHCLHHEQHKPYQDRRAMEKRPSAPARRDRPPDDDPLSDERLSWLALHAQTPLAEIARTRPAFTDADAVLAMEYALEKMTTGGLILLSGQDRKPGREAGEAVRQSLETCRFERSILLTDEREGYTANEKIRVLERLIVAARSFARQNPAGRTYLERIAAQFESLHSEAAKPKILA